MDILAFDLSKSGTGWARYCSDGNSRLRSGSVRLGGAHTDRIGMMRVLYQFVLDECAFGNPDLVIYEGPLPGQAQSTEKNNRNANAMVAVIEFFFGSCNRIRVQEVHNLTWKREFFTTTIPRQITDPITGKRGRNPSYDPKAICVERCRQLGFRPDDHNEADAIGILHYALRCEGITPLWMAE